MLAANSQHFTDLRNRLNHLSGLLKNRVVGQPQTVDPIIDFMARGESGLADPKRPLASFISLGPTGVGKTETVKVIVEDYFQDERALVRLDMSAYKSIESIGQFIGTADRKGHLQKKIEAAEGKGRILLLDELEKAHPDIFDLLLQILDEGWLTYLNGDHANFRTWYIWCTSNIGSEMSTRGNNPNETTMREALIAKLRQTIRPEIVERFSQILCYNRLSLETQLAIADSNVLNELARLNSVARSAFTIPDLPTFTTFMRKEGYTKEFGARRMRGTIQRHMQSAFFEALASGSACGELTVSRGKVRIISAAEPSGNSSLDASPSTATGNNGHLVWGEEYPLPAEGESHP